MYYMTVDQCQDVLTDMDDIFNVDPKAYQKVLDDFYNFLTDMVETHDNGEDEIDITYEDKVKIDFIQEAFKLIENR